MMAPTDRSMPAVRITSVWAMPSTAMMVTCCSTSDRLNRAKKRPPTTTEKMATPTISTMKGIAVGYSCRKCCNCRSPERRSSSKLATVRSWPASPRSAVAWPLPSSLIALPSRRPHEPAA